VAVLKLAAGREKDLRYVEALVRTRLADRAVISGRISMLAEPVRSLAGEHLRRL
jgi:hypothetical protein